MVDASFGFDGSDPDDLADDLDALSAAITARLEEALETWTLLTEASAKRLAPVDTGRLRASITTEVRRAGATIIKASIGSNVEYSGYVETGTSKMSSQPYLRPAIEQHRSDLERLVGEALDQAKADVN